jgi:hypothetical protein
MWFAEMTGARFALFLDFFAEGAFCAGAARVHNPHSTLVKVNAA